MNTKELEEFRYDVAHSLLSKMSKGSQFQHALDKVIDLIKDATEQELCEMAPSEVIKQTKKKDKPAQGF